ncbi:hypothetical protein ACFL1Y_01120 [Patescibacteria group bacterium]
MKYKVHKFRLKMTKDSEELEIFLNNLNGEVTAIIPNVQPKFLPMGATAEVDFLLIVEKIN